MDSIDFDFLLNDDDGDLTDEPVARDPRVVRSIESVAHDAEARRYRQEREEYPGPGPDDDDLGWSDAEILSLDESELECLWPQWGDRRCSQPGRGIPAGVTVTPQHLPRTASTARPLSYK